MKADCFIYATRKLSCTMKTLKSISCDRRDTYINFQMCLQKIVNNEQTKDVSFYNRKNLFYNLVYHKFKQTKLKVKSLIILTWNMYAALLLKKLSKKHKIHGFVLNLKDEI